MDTPWIGDGSIKQAKDELRKGKWRLQWVYVEDGKKVRVDRLFSTKGEATAWREEKKLELRTGVRREVARKKAAPVLTVQAMFDELAGTRELEHRDGKWVGAYGSTPLTVVTKLHRWNKWVKGSPIASRPVRALLRDDAYAQVERMKKAGATVATMKDVLGILKLLVNCAIAEKPECRNMTNPFVRMVLQTNADKAKAAIAKQKAEATAPTKIVIGPGQAREGMERVGDLEALAALAVHLLGGLRLGEGMALCVEQVDFDRGVIVVDRSVHLEANAGQTVGLPKRNKIRLVAMCPTLATILRAHVDELPDGYRYLFPSERRDKPRMKYRYYLLWKNAIAAAELPDGFGPQDARLSHNNWIEKLMPAVSLSTRLEHMGHSLDRGQGQPSGVAVNINNYTAHIPDAYDILRRDLERTVFGPALRVEQGGRAA